MTADHRVSMTIDGWIQPGLQSADGSSNVNVTRISLRKTSSSPFFFFLGSPWSIRYLPK